jgi:hypothetical protein
MTQPKKPGRPQNEEPGSRVSTWLPASQHDQLVRMAKQRDVSVSAVVRSLLTHRRHGPRRWFPL